MTDNELAAALAKNSGYSTGPNGDGRMRLTMAFAPGDEIKAFAAISRALATRPANVREALEAAYTAGATDVHEWWAAGNTEREADFGEAASDYARSIDLTALTQAPRSCCDAERSTVARCIAIARRVRDEFLSEDYATGQPESSFSERFACDTVAKAIEDEFAMGTSEQRAIATAIRSNSHD